MNAQPPIRRFLERVDPRRVDVGPREWLAVERLLRAGGTSWAYRDLRAALASILARDEAQWLEIARLFDQVFKRSAEHEVAAGGEAAERSEALRIEAAPRPSLRRRAVRRAQVLVGRIARAVRNAPRGLWVTALAATVAALIAAPYVAFLRQPITPQPPPAGDPVAAPPVEQQGSVFLVPVGHGREASTGTEMVKPPEDRLGSAGWLVAIAGALMALGFHFVRAPAAARRRQEERFEARRKRSDEDRERLEARQAAAGRPVELRYKVDVRLDDRAAQAVRDSAEVLGRLFRGMPSDALDPPATVDRTIARAGRFSPIFARRFARHEILVLYAVEAGCPPFLPAFRRLLEAWRAQGIGLRCFTFQLTPDSLTDTLTRRPIHIGDLARQTEGMPLILFARKLDPGGFRRPAAWPTWLRAWPRRVWLDADPRMAEQLPQDRLRMVAALETLGLRRFDLSPGGVLASALALAGQLRGGAGEAPPLPALPKRRPAGQGDAVGEALRIWAFVGAQVPDPTWDQLEAIRRHFPEIHQNLPDPRSLHLLIAWVERETGHPAERSGARGGLFIPEAHAEAWKTEQRRFENAGEGGQSTASRLAPSRLERRARQLLIEQLAGTRPEDELEALWWRFKVAMHRAILQPEEAEALLVELLDSPIAHEVARHITYELDRQEEVGGLRFDRVATEALRARTGRLHGIPLRALVSSLRGGWRSILPAAAGALVLLAALIGGRPWNEHFETVRHVPAASVPVYRVEADTAKLPTMIRLRGGTFAMGSDQGDRDERPVHPVTVAPFEISKTEVTVAQYRACVEAEACKEPDTGRSCNWDVDDREQHPINCVSWDDAKSHAAWIGARLPSEAEWEYAARSGGLEQAYPWGDEPADCSRAVIRDAQGSGCGKASTWDVCAKSNGNTEQGLCDMAGNVWEWVEDDWHDRYTGAPDDGRAWVDQPRGEDRVSRGGSFWNEPQFARVADRNWAPPADRGDGLGFRVARSLPSSP